MDEQLNLVWSHGIVPRSGCIPRSQRSFLFGHDANGNDVQMTVLDQDDNRMLTESYEIVTVSDNGEWLEKWGYLNDSPSPVTFYSKRKSE